MKFFTTETDWQVKGSEFRVRLAEVEQQITAAQASRSSYALGAADGDASAQKELDRLTKVEGQLQRQASDLREAIRQCEVKHSAQLAEQEAERERERLKQVEVESVRLLKECVEVDNHARALVAALEKVDQSESRLSALGHPYANRLKSPNHVTRMLRCFGVHTYADIPHMAPQHCRPLAETVRTLIEAAKRSQAA